MSECTFPLIRSSGYDRAVSGHNQESNEEIKKEIIRARKEVEEAGKFLCLPFSNLRINFAPFMFFKFY